MKRTRAHTDLTDEKDMQKAIDNNATTTASSSILKKRKTPLSKSSFAQLELELELEHELKPNAPRVAENKRLTRSLTHEQAVVVVAPSPKLEVFDVDPKNKKKRSVRKPKTTFQAYKTAASSTTTDDDDDDGDKDDEEIAVKLAKLLVGPLSGPGSTSAGPGAASPGPCSSSGSS